MNLTNKTQRAILGYKLESQTNDEIELDLLKAYLDATEKYGNTTVNIQYSTLKLKYEALTTVPTIIETKPCRRHNYTQQVVHSGRITIKELRLDAFSNNLMRNHKLKKVSIEHSPSSITTKIMDR